MIKAFKKIMILGLALVVLFSLAACGSDKAAIERVEKHAGIKLPADIEVIFNYRFTNVVFGSPQSIYTVFRLKEKPEAFLNDNGFVPGTKEQESRLSNYRGYEKHEEIPNEFCPPWREEFVWVGKNDVTLLYFIVQQKLIAIQ